MKFWIDTLTAGGVRYFEVWYTEPPAWGTKYHTLRELWTDNYRVRHVYEWEQL